MSNFTPYRNGLIAIVLLFLLTSAVVWSGHAEAADRWIGTALGLTVEASPHWLIAFMQGVSWFNGGLPRWGIVILLSALVWHWCGPRCAVALGGASLLANGASSLLKLAFGVARPDLVPHLDHQTSFAYPSGHATSAAVVYLLLAWLAPERWRAAAWALAAAMILLGGLSRIMLGVHWTSDIVGGTMLGAAFALLGAAFVKQGRPAA